jgi:hypothetical protein
VSWQYTKKWTPSKKKQETKFHILELLHKCSKSHEEKDDEQGDEKDEKTHNKKITITTIAITATIPTTTTKKKVN